MPAETHVERSPMDRQQVFDLIRDRLSDILEVEPSTIHEGDSFTDDLDADSLALIELAEALEEELGERSVGFRIEDEDLEDIKTVRDAVDKPCCRWCERTILRRWRFLSCVAVRSPCRTTSTHQW